MGIRRSMPEEMAKLARRNLKLELASNSAIGWMLLGYQARRWTVRGGQKAKLPREIIIESGNRAISPLAWPDFRYYYWREPRHRRDEIMTGTQVIANVFSVSDGAARRRPARTRGLRALAKWAPEIRAGRDTAFKSTDRAVPIHCKARPGAARAQDRRGNFLLSHFRSTKSKLNSWDQFQFPAFTQAVVLKAPPIWVTGCL